MKNSLITLAFLCTFLASVWGQSSIPALPDTYSYNELIYDLESAVFVVDSMGYEISEVLTAEVRQSQSHFQKIRLPENKRFMLLAVLSRDVSEVDMRLFDQTSLLADQEKKPAPNMLFLQGFNKEAKEVKFQIENSKATNPFRPYGFAILVAIERTDIIAQGGDH